MYDGIDFLRSGDPKTRLFVALKSKSKRGLANLLKHGAGFSRSISVRYGSRDGAACAEFSWEGFDDGSAASGRGWALGGAGRLVGHIFIHKGDDSVFVAERE